MAAKRTSQRTLPGEETFVYLEPKATVGRFDQDVLQATHEFELFGTAEMERMKGNWVSAIS